MSDPLARRIVDFATDCRLDDVPAPVQALARLHALDAVGVGLGASRLSVNRGLVDRLATLGAAGNARCSLLGSRAAVSAPMAALGNGTLIHSLEFDDTHMASIVHGSAVVVPAALAAAQQHALGTRAFVRLVTIGWEALVRIGLAAPGAFQRRGFQVTSVGGTLVAALLGAIAQGASRGQAVAAIGIAGSQAGGIFEFLSDGSSVKAMHPGWAAHSGLIAAELAMAGMTGPATVLEGRFGVFRAHGDAPQGGEALASLLDGLGGTWLLAQAAFKFHPCCHYIHPFLECADDLRGRVPEVDSIVSIECEVPEGEAAIICEPWDRKRSPASRNDAKYSLPYCLARRLLGRTLDVDDFAGGPVDADAIRLAARITWRPMQDSGFPARFPARLRARLADGREVVVEVAQVDGSAERPPDASRVVEKFRRNVEGACTPRGADALVEALLGEADLPIESLARALHAD